MNSTKLKSYRWIRPCTVVWLLLMALTLSTLAIGKFDLIDSIGGGPLVAFLLITIFIKSAMISEYFMGLKVVRWRWRMIPLIYLIIVCGLIWIAYNRA
ncbi:MAG: cytochrome C oxidase subunit IV family protein [Gammaproteobacteria bacterium]|nr:cytochrome C oxidase subunit IV family protein [Gammaproteobacteria bacterium]